VWVCACVHVCVCVCVCMHPISSRRTSILETSCAIIYLVSCICDGHGRVAVPPLQPWHHRPPASLRAPSPFPSPSLRASDNGRARRAIGLEPSLKVARVAVAAPDDDLVTALPRACWASARAGRPAPHVGARRSLRRWRERGPRGVQLVGIIGTLMFCVGGGGWAARTHSTAG